MSKALIGKYYKTFEAAEKAFFEMPEWEQERKCIIEFSNGYLITGKLQAEKL